MSKRNSFLAVTLMGVFAFAFSSHAQTTNLLVHDTWLDGTRTDPASPTYAENNGVVGTDVDADGDLESAWFQAGNGGLVTSTGHMVMTNLSATSTSFETYFTPTATPVTLANAGDEMTLTWVFTPTGVGANNTSQNFRLAVVNSAGARLTADGTQASANFQGYAMFMNMGGTLGNSNPFSLDKRAIATSSDLLGTSGNWSKLTNNVASGAHGFDSGTTYTYTMTLTRTAGPDNIGGDADDGLSIVSSISGGTFNGTGSGTDVFTDTTPSSFVYDTFGVRPSSGATTAAQFDTSLFQVQFITVPEPSAVALVGTGLGLMLGLVRRRRS